MNRLLCNLEFAFNQCSAERAFSSLILNNGEYLGLPVMALFGHLKFSSDSRLLDLYE
jgi:hypothetical protein